MGAKIIRSKAHTKADNSIVKSINILDKKFNVNFKRYFFKVVCNAIQVNRVIFSIVYKVLFLI
jgi:hypothetical protein